ncbi:MAG TPA: GDSL-type esterase/lipase family protein [Tepidisphaeraceae bacterium]|jgi:lysophospholipase L1-like esterase|nr:GDSL-type esterase/lipase family protein [Tepidisphaeraceae bacterium]
MSKLPWKILSRTLLGACLFSGVVTFSAVADTPTPAPAKPQPQHEAADKPAPKHDRKNPEEPEPGFVKRHEGFLNDLKAKDGKVGILFVGDSITDGWRGRGKEVFAKTYGSLDPLNIGIGGDRTQHVLWRLDRGEVDGISPKVAVLMIGTNNLGGNTNEEIVAGNTAIVNELKAKLPKTKVLLLGIFPRSPKPTDPARARIKAINEELAKLDDGGKTVKYLDIGPKFLDADGNLPKDIMPDSLHPNAKGYQIWADATAPALEELMK